MIEITELGDIIGTGRMAQVFVHPDDPHKIIKLFYSKVKKETVNYEFEICKKLDLTAIQTPEVYQTVSYQNRFGIVMERIAGHTLVAVLPRKIFGVSTYGQKFAKLQYDIHQEKAENLPSYSAQLEERIKRVPDLNNEQKSRIIDRLLQLPKGKKICHSDFHPDNVMLSNDGYLVAIDWIDAKAGNPLFDVARTNMILQYSSPPSSFLMKWLINKFRSNFNKSYIEEYSRLSSIDVMEIEKFMLPVLAARLIEGIEDEREAILEQINLQLDDE